MIFPEYFTSLIQGRFNGLIKNWFNLKGLVKLILCVTFFLFKIQESLHQFRLCFQILCFNWTELNTLKINLHDPTSIRRSTAIGALSLIQLAQIRDSTTVVARNCATLMSPSSIQRGEQWGTDQYCTINRTRKKNQDIASHSKLTNCFAHKNHVNYFRNKRFIIDIRLGSKYASGVSQWVLRNRFQPNINQSFAVQIKWLVSI